MKIRKARPEDAAQMSKVHQLSIQVLNSKDYTKKQIIIWSKMITPERHAGFLKNPKYFPYIAEEGGKIVGIGSFYKSGELRLLYIITQCGLAGVSARSY